MSTNIVITSDDVKKSQAIGDLIAGTLELHGFSNITSTFPAYRSIEGVNDDRTALEVLQDRYPGFLGEPVTIRAVPVIGLDKSFPRVELISGNIEREVAFLTTRVTGEGDTVIAFKEQGHEPPVNLNKVPNIAKVVERAVANIASDATSRLDLSYAAWQLNKEGVLPDALKVADQIGEVEQQTGLRRIVEHIEDETFFGTNESSPALEAAKRENEVAAKRSKFHVVEKEEQE